MTPVGAHIDHVDDEVDAAFDSAGDLADQAERRQGTAVDEVRRIGGLRVRLRITGARLAAALMPALAHHPRGEVAGGYDVEMRAWEGAAAGGGLPPFPRSALDGGTSGASRVEADRRGRHRRLRYQPDERALSLYDPDPGRALFCVADPAELPYWERGAPMRALFHWIMEDRGRCLVHAAAVGRPGGGLLIVGRGGSGKSTTALACVGRGLRYLSDDYCIVEPRDPVPRAHSLYSTAKLHHDQVSRLPHLAGWVTNGQVAGETAGAAGGDEKALLFVADHAAEDDLIETFPIRAVVVPTITGGRATTFGPTSAGSVLRALAPSSVLQAPGGGAGALARLAGLVRSTPSIELRLGTDIDALAGRLERLLDELDAERTR